MNLPAMPLKAKKYNTMDEFFAAELGAYILEKAEGRLGVLMTLPCGHRFMPDSKWTLANEADQDKITLSPSIQCSPQVPCWHGYLKNGEFINA
jgi:hypothetical protein